MSGNKGHFIFEFVDRETCNRTEYYSSLEIEKYQYGQLSIESCSWAKDIENEQFISRHEAVNFMPKEDAVLLRDALIEMYPIEDTKGGQ